MPCFVCAKCQCVDNTALAHYWCRKYIDEYIWPENLQPYKGLPLCCVCAPQQFADRSATKYGKWHGKFERKHIDEYPEIDRNQLLK